MGVFNFMYFVIWFIDWFVFIGFFLGVLFRFMVVVGVVKYVFYFMRVVLVFGVSELIKGFFMFKGKEEVV